MAAVKWFFVNPPDSNRSSYGREFVYIIMKPVSLGLEPTVPLYVGGATHLSKRLSNHAFINKVNRFYGAPVPVFVAGTVRVEGSGDAVSELATSFTKVSGFTVVADFSETKSFVFPSQTSFGLFTELVEEWRTSWFVKTGGKETTTLGVGEKTNTSLTPVPLSPVSQVELMRWCSAVNYSSVQERDLVLNIAYRFNETVGYTTYFLTKSERELVFNGRASKLRKIFLFPNNVRVGQDVLFRVQPSFVKKNRFSGV